MTERLGRALRKFVARANVLQMAAFAAAGRGMFDTMSIVTSVGLVVIAARNYCLLQRTLNLYISDYLNRIPGMARQSSPYTLTISVY
jgi:hypothetical protein